MSVWQLAVLAQTCEGQVWVGADVPSVKKLAVSFGLCNSPRLLDIAQESRLSPSGDVLL